MALVEPRPPQGLYLRFVYWYARRLLGRVPLPTRIMAHSRTVLSASAAYEMTIRRAKCLDPRLRDLAVLKTAMQIGCRFCIDIGAWLSKNNGVTEADLHALVDHAKNPHWSELERQVLDYAVAMNETPMTTPSALSQALRLALGEAALVELTAAVAWEGYRARFNHAFGAKEEGYSERMVCLLPAAASHG